MGTGPAGRFRGDAEVVSPECAVTTAPPAGGGAETSG